jgi:excisionase family DNA binding protein
MNENIIDLNKYVTTNEACKRYGLSLPCIHNRIKRGQLPVLKIHGKWNLIRISDLDRMAAK